MHLVVRNTFLDVVDGEDPLKRLSRSQSDSSLPSSTSSSCRDSGTKSVEPPAAVAPPQHDLNHVIYSDSSSTPSNTSALNVPSERRYAEGPPGKWTSYPPAGDRDGPVVERALLLQGGLLHNDGACRPCSFFVSKKGCANGEECQFCHAAAHGNLNTTSMRKQRMREKEAKAALMRHLHAQDAASSSSAPQQAASAAAPSSLPMMSQDLPGSAQSRFEAERTRRLPQISAGIAGGKASGMGSAFDDELSRIMTQLEVPKAFQDRLIASNCRELRQFATYVEDVAEFTAILGAMDPAIIDRGEVCKVRRAFKVAQARDTELESHNLLLSAQSLTHGRTDIGSVPFGPVGGAAQIGTQAGYAHVMPRPTLPKTFLSL